MSCVLNSAIWSGLLAARGRVQRRPAYRTFPVVAWQHCAPTPENSFYLVEIARDLPSQKKFNATQAQGAPAVAAANPHPHPRP
jgi:hypothetical protein